MPMTSNRRVRTLIAASLLCGFPMLHGEGAQAPGVPAVQAPPQPTFRASTDRIAIDVTVVGDTGDVVSGLTADDFVLTVDGKPRPVVSAEFLRTSDAPAPSGAAAGPTGTTFSSNESTAGGRLVLLAFDLDGIAAGGGRELARAAAGFVDALAPTDQVGLVAFPAGANIPFSPDRAPVRDALAHVVGRGAGEFPHAHAIGLSEAFDIEDGNTFALSRVVERECQRTREENPVCPRLVEEEAHTLATTYRIRSQRALQTFQALLVSLQKVDAPKILIWVSGGVPLPFAEVALGTLSAAAAAAHATVYVVHLDNPTAGVDASHALRSPTQTADRAIARHGLEMMAGVTRGAVFSSSGTGEDAFARIAREMSAYYLLSADADPSDRDGRTHRITVTLKGRTGTVRARRDFVVPTPAAAAARPRTPEEEVVRVLQAPIPASGLPLAVATYNLLAPGGDKVRVIVASDIGRSESAPLDATLGYTVRSAEGKAVASAVHTTKAELMDQTAPGPVHATVAIDLPPGAYRLKLAVVDAQGRTGSVEHSFEASVKGNGGLQVADLVLAPPVSESAPAMRLTAAPGARAAPLDAYLELYGATGAAAPRVRVAVTDQDNGPTLAAADAPVSQRGEKGRYVAGTTLPLGLLPPGTYVARATVTLGATTAERTRQFRILEPVPADDVFKADLEARVGAFDRNDVLTPALLGPAVTSAAALDGGRSGDAAHALVADVAAGRLDGLARLSRSGTESLLTSFLRGLASYRAGRIEEAAGHFRAAIRGSSDFLSGVFYLGACYAAGGKTREAVAAWQTALIADSPPPDVYRVIADADLRLGNADEASELLEEAAARWPDDEAFRIQGAIARAANGHIDEALAGLGPSLEGQGINPQIGALAVQLAVARVARQQDAGAASALRDLVARLTAGGVEVPSIAARWLAYLDRQPAP